MRVNDFLYDFYDEYIRFKILDKYIDKGYIGSEERSEFDLIDPDDPNFLDSIVKCSDYDTYSEKELIRLDKKIYQEVLVDKLTELGYDVYWTTEKVIGDSSTKMGHWVIIPSEAEGLGIRRLEDKLSLDYIEDNYPWILEADIERAVLGEGGWKEEKVIKWIDGWWNDGVWEVGIWKKGGWYGGKWKDGKWEYGYWENGEWMDGEWLGGRWKNGKWYDGIWYNGQWYDGEWLDGEWKYGTWYNGIWYDGRWYKGNWKNGTWLGGIWYDGDWWNGKWNGGIWENGRWMNGEWKDGTWENGVWYQGKWIDGEWLGGKWVGGYDKNGNWHGAGDSPDKWDN